MLSALIYQHEKYRSSGINLIVSENTLLPAASQALASDFAGRYSGEWYGGTRYATQMIAEVTRLTAQLFHAKHAFITPLSGNICDLATLFSFTPVGGSVAAVPKEKGGYPLGYHKFHRQLIPLPTEQYRIPVLAAKECITRECPDMTMLGASTILFPHPVSALTVARDFGTLVYDASHVLGLVAGGQFQQPLEEGAEVVVGSTHKSFPGPQGGIVLTNDDEKADQLHTMLSFDFEQGIGLVDNPHLNRIAALGIVLEELLAHGHEYAHQIVQNAQALAQALHDLDMPVACAEDNFTRTHQVLLNISQNETYNFCKSLERQHIFVDIAGRIGVAETAHIGMKESEMDIIAQLMVDAYHGKEVKEEVKHLAGQFYHPVHHPGGQ